jgi:hypothetical protein
MKVTKMIRRDCPTFIHMKMDAGTPTISEDRTVASLPNVFASPNASPLI